MRNILIVAKGISNNGIGKYIVDIFVRFKEKYKDYNVNVAAESVTPELLKTLRINKINYIKTPSLKKGVFNYLRQWNKIISPKKVDIIHFEIDNYVNFYPILRSKMVKIKSVIIQSHNSTNYIVKNNLLKNSIHCIIRQFIPALSTSFIAVSNNAVSWMFPKRIEKKVEVLLNPIEKNNFLFNMDSRLKLREKFHIKGKLLLSVGRFEYQKNPLYTLRVFNEYKKNDRDAMLLMIGEGSLREEMKQFIIKNSLKKSVLVLEWQTNIQQFLNAADVLLFPSRFEGYPLTLVEAQDSGLAVIYAENIDRNIEMSDNIYALGISDDKVENWANLIASINLSIDDRIKNSQIFFKSNYADIGTHIESIKKIYEI